MTVLSLIKRIPSYASDVKINLNQCFDSVPDTVTQVQCYGVALTVSYMLKNEDLLNDIRAEAKIYLEDVDAMACKMAAIITSSHSITDFFKSNIDSFDVAEDSNKLKFSMQDTLKVPEKDKMMYLLAASMIVRDVSRVSRYIKELKSLSKNRDHVDEEIYFIVKVAATLKSACEALEIETLRSYDFIARGASF